MILTLNLLDLGSLQRGLFLGCVIIGHYLPSHIFLLINLCSARGRLPLLDHLNSYQLFWQLNMVKTSCVVTQCGVI